MLTIWKPNSIKTEKRDNYISPFEYFDRVFEHSLGTAFQDLYGNFFNNLGIEYTKTDSGISINIDVPGVKESDISVNMANGMVHIKAERKTTNSSNRIEKSFTIPEGYDTENIEASLSDGILSLSLKTLPKKEKEIKKIEIKSGTKQLNQ